MIYHEEEGADMAGKRRGAYEHRIPKQSSWQRIKKSTKIPPDQPTAPTFDAMLRSRALS